MSSYSDSVAVREVRAGSSRDTSREASSVHIAEGNGSSTSAVGVVGAGGWENTCGIGRDSSGISCGGEATVGVVGAGGRGDTSGPLGSLARHQGRQETQRDL